jgi:hypothetical protein
MANKALNTVRSAHWTRKSCAFARLLANRYALENLWKNINTFLSFYQEMSFQRKLLKVNLHL